LVTGESPETSKKNKERIAKRAMLRESQKTAIKVLEKLDELDWTQKDLAERMGVSPQYVSKMLKGKENFTLETLVSLQEILDIPIFASYYDQKEEQKAGFIGEEMSALLSTLVCAEYQTVITTDKNYVVATQNTYQTYKIAG
jgi:transcriptional regulator with XRE-family HTH domain